MVAAAILNLTRPSATKKLQSLRRKHPSSIKVPNQGLFKYTALLIQSFARDKGEQEMKETVLTSRARVYAFYISIFEKLNAQFLTGHLMMSFMKINIVSSHLTEGCTFSRTEDTVFNVLVRAELFISSVFLTGGASRHALSFSRQLTI